MMQFGMSYPGTACSREIFSVLGAGKFQFCDSVLYIMALIIIVFKAVELPEFY